MTRRRILELKFGSTTHIRVEQSQVGEKSAWGNPLVTLHLPPQSPLSEVDRLIRLARETVREFCAIYGVPIGPDLAELWFTVGLTPQEQEP